jgi:hypothetical protein
MTQQNTMEAGMGAVVIIPNIAWEKAVAAYEDAAGVNGVGRAVEAAAPLILAAELQRLIDILDIKAQEAGIGGGIYANGRRDGLEAAGTELYRRVSELRGED